MIINEIYDKIGKEIKEIAQEKRPIKKAQRLKQEKLKSFYINLHTLAFDDLILLEDYIKIVANPIIPTDKIETRQLKLNGQNFTR